MEGSEALRRTGFTVKRRFQLWPPVTDLIEIDVQLPQQEVLTAFRRLLQQQKPPYDLPLRPFVGWEVPGGFQLDPPSRRYQVLFGSAVLVLLTPTNKATRVTVHVAIPLVGWLLFLLVMLPLTLFVWGDLAGVSRFFAVWVLLLCAGAFFRTRATERVIFEVLDAAARNSPGAA